MRIVLLNILLLLLNSMSVQGQSISKVWCSDLGNGNYKNPVIHADYSDPDAIRVNDDYYMISSSFNHIPGLPILHSKDLVNWKLVGHVLQRLYPYDHFNKVQHGGGVWAPSIRYHKGEFYIYYPDPDFGIFLTRAANINGPWTEPILVEAGKGLIDPCPLWDNDGKVYLVHAYAGSRAGIKSIIVVKQMNREGTKTIDAGKLVYDGHDLDPTIEGPKFYKRNGWYYIFAPAGGVSTGWQLVLRSKNVYGPYERKVVMDEGNSKINGPHQGAWVDTRSGENWFLHFQDKEEFGRVVHLQPMKWVNDWPLIGIDKDGDGKGEPLISFKKPGVASRTGMQTIADSDEFNSADLSLQWQWQANPQPYWYFISNGKMRLYSYKIADSSRNYWSVPNLLLQKFPSNSFEAGTRFTFKGKWEGERAGIIVHGSDYASLLIEKTKDGNILKMVVCKGADKGNSEQLIWSKKLESGEVEVKVRVTPEGICQFFYAESTTNEVLHQFQKIDTNFKAKPGRWVGAKIGIFCTRINTINDSGHAEFDWFRFEKPGK